VARGTPLRIDGSTLTAEEDEQIRQRLVEYFSILREWDVTLKQSESEDTFDFHQP
jgi:hypothetical protein